MTTFGPVRYIFVREFGSRHGLLQRELDPYGNRDVKIVGRAYLNLEGWLMHSNGSWLAPGGFQTQTAPPPKLSLSLAQIITEAMQQAQRILGDLYHSHPPINYCEPVHSSERDSRHQHSL